jgi:hypothetical protein
MKKYILPAIILIISIIYINQVTEPSKEEKPAASVTKPDILPSIMTNSGAKKVLLLEKKGADPQSISKKKLSGAMEQAETISVMPWERLSITYPIYPSKLTFTEYDPGEGVLINYEQEDDWYMIPSTPGIRGLIITAEWAQGGKATYFAKIDVQSVYSYQEMVSLDPEIFTVIAFSETESYPEIPPSVDGTYTIQTVTGSQEELKRDFPDLGIADLPAFFVFQTSDMIFETHEYDQLISFLTKKEVLLYEGESENWKVTLTVEQKIGNGTFETQLTYKGKNGNELGQFESTFNGQSWSIGEGHQLDENNQSNSIDMVTWPIAKTEKVNYKVRWDGKEETIPLSLNEDQNS